MKRFEELKRLAKKAHTVSFHFSAKIEDRGDGCIFFRFPVEQVQPSTILALLADRERLRNVIKYMTVDNCYDERIWDEAAEALKKSDEVEKIKEIVEV